MTLAAAVRGDDRMLEGTGFSSFFRIKKISQVLQDYQRCCSVDLVHLDSQVIMIISSETIEDVEREEDKDWLTVPQFSTENYETSEYTS